MCFAFPDKVLLASSVFDSENSAGGRFVMLRLMADDVALLHQLRWILEGGRAFARRFLADRKK